MSNRTFRDKKDCKAERHSLGIVKIADGWVCYFCGTKVSDSYYTPGTSFESNKPYNECHCYCFQPRTDEEKNASDEKWLDEPISDEFLDPRIAEPEGGWKFRYKRNIARTCPICFEDLNWWGEEGSENLVCSNVKCGLDESTNEINHHLWRERFVGLLNQQAIEALQRVGEDIPGGGTESAKIFEGINKLIKEYGERERVHEPNEMTPRALGLKPIGSATIKKSKINPQLLKELESKS